MANKTKLRLNQISGSLGARTGGNGVQHAFTFAAGSDNAVYINMDTRNTNLLTLGSANVGVVLDGALSGGKIGRGAGKIFTQDAGIDDDDFLRVNGNNVEGLSAAETRTAIQAQASSARLTDIAGLAVTDSSFIVGDGSNFVLENASTARSSLGLGTAATQAVGLNANQVPQVEANIGADLFLRSHASNATIVGVSAADTRTAIGAQATLTFGIGNGNAMKFAGDANAQDNEFLHVKGTDIESLSYTETAALLKLNALADPDGARSMNSQKITGLAAPTAGTDAATKAYVDSVAAGLRWLEPVEVATTGELNTNAAGVTYVDNDNALKRNGNGALGNIDGQPITFNNNEAQATRILVKNQAGVKGFLQFSVDTVPANGENMTFEVNDVYYQVNFVDGSTDAGWGGGNGSNSGARKTINIKRNNGGESEGSIATSIANKFNTEPGLSAQATAEVVRIDQSDPKDTAVTWNVAGTAGSDNESQAAGVSSRNGIYWAYADGSGGAPWELRRATDAISLDDLSSAAVFVERGISNSDQGFVQSVDIGGGDSIDDTHQNWVQFTGGAALTAGNGVTKNGNNFEMDIKSLGSVGAALSDTDKLAFMDDDDSDNTKAKTVADVLTGFAGVGLTRAGGALDVRRKTNGGIGQDSGELRLDFSNTGNVNGQLALAQGGTGGNSAASAMNNISPVTTRGDMIYRDAGGNQRLAKGTEGTVLVMGADDPGWSNSILNTSLGKIGTAGNQEYIDFGQANEIRFAINDVVKMRVENSMTKIIGALDVEAGNIQAFHDANGADVRLTMGTGAAECLELSVITADSDKIIDIVEFVSKTSDGGANKGIFGFKVDQSSEYQLQILDDGIAIQDGGTAANGKLYIGNTDTALSRQGPGDVNIGANIIYRAGGTDVPVADGGTGSSTASGARTNLGATTVGGNIFTLANPGAVSFLRMNGDNTVTARSAADFKNDLGLGTAASATRKQTVEQAAALAPNTSLAIPTGGGDFHTTFAGAGADDREIYLNGQLLLEGNDLNANKDWYEQSGNNVRFEFGLEIGDVVQFVCRA